jgi:oxygen-dependent protoporphyrinogen oxidase
VARVVVVGAGISGLAVARELRERGQDPLVLESEGRAGGKVRSSRREGFLLEEGPASFVAREPAVTALVRELGLEERVVRASEAAGRRCVALDGALEVVPSGPGALLRTPILPVRAKLRLLADLVLPRGPAARGREESVAGFARRRLGRAAAERVLYPLVSGIYAGDPERASLPSSFPALAALEREHRSLIAGAAWSALVHGSASARLVTFQDGMQELTDALARSLGERLVLGAALERVESTGKGLRLRVRARAGPEAIECDAVVLALPAHAAAGALVSLDGGVGAALDAIPYAPVTLVNLGWDRVLALDAYGFLVAPGEDAGLLGCVFASAAFPNRAPAGATLVSARIGGMRRPELARCTDAELVELVRVDLRRYCGIEAAPNLVQVVRHPRALPQYVLGHAERLSILEQAETRHRGLVFAGNAYAGLGIPDCIRNAATVADRTTRALVVR